MFLTAQQEGAKSTEKAPTEFILMKYRQHFGISWHDLMEMPWGIVIQDLDMLEIEEKVLQSKNNPKK